MANAAFIIPNDEGEKAESARTGTVPPYETSLRNNRLQAIKQLFLLPNEQLDAFANAQKSLVNWEDMCNSPNKAFTVEESVAAQLASAHHTLLDHLSLASTPGTPGTLAAPALETPFGDRPADDPALYQEDGSQKSHSELAQMFAEDDIRTIAQTILTKNKTAEISP
jgi:hypothetical protein